MWLLNSLFNHDENDHHQNFDSTLVFCVNTLYSGMLSNILVVEQVRMYTTSVFLIKRQLSTPEIVKDT